MQCHTTVNEKSTQTLHAGCNKAQPKILPRCRPPSWGCRTAKI